MAKELAAVPISDVTQALSGKVAGVQVIRSQGSPDADVSIKVRGGTSITQSNEPLYIIDGFPSEDGLKGIESSDIESIDILKDASSTAIYGARGANGVILVTTKQGRTGKLDIALDTYVGWQNVYKKPELLNAQQYVEIMNEAYANDNKTLDWANLVPDWNRIQNGWEGPQWFESALNKNAFIRNHSLNISGGSERSVFSIGISNTSQEGTIGKPVAPVYERTGRHYWKACCSGL